ncbi:GNAT family N-acetyltransferase [Streptomyces sp. UNOB3_S3]|uniref:GNAT family N-acetyltransferase n=1 Tax=Streptomyces sp. UNOB3_S3 TaxID=2871682 RepID=UPI001E562C41|nr:GNAT family protein [Streptomyces sp. UNOB3_S3]MCC3778542.1 GNAT family N-acetyltransferase [Streptomyces sp. UNOB3_S3]
MTIALPSLTPTTLTAEGLLLRPFRENDEPAVAEALRDADILRWAAGDATVQAPVDERAAVWLRLRMAAWANGDACFAVTDEATGELHGALSVREVHRLPDQAVTGYWVTPRSRGRGAARTALDTAARWALAAPEDGGLGVHRIYLDHVLANVASCRVAVAAGFRLEGVMRDHFKEPSGRRHDAHLHARLATDRPE